MLDNIKTMFLWHKYRVQIMSNMAYYIISKAMFIKQGYQLVDDPFSISKKLIKNNEDVHHSIDFYIEKVCDTLSMYSTIDKRVYLKLCAFKFNDRKDCGIINLFKYFKVRLKEKILMQKVANSLALKLDDFINGKYLCSLYHNVFKQIKDQNIRFTYPIHSDSSYS